MIAETENIVLEHLRWMRGALTGLQEDMRDVKFRIGQVEENVMHLTHRIDRLDERMGRIERRLDLVEA